MDKLAAALEIDPVELRLKNALATRDQLLTGQVLTGSLPVARCIRALPGAPPPPAADPARDPIRLPGGAGRHDALSHTSGGAPALRSGSRTSPSPRGSTTTTSARVRLELGADGEPVPRARRDRRGGPGGSGAIHQVARTELGITRSCSRPARPRGRLGRLRAASRHTRMAAGAVRATPVRAALEEFARPARKSAAGVQQPAFLAGRANSRAPRGRRAALRLRPSTSYAKRTPSRTSRRVVARREHDIVDSQLRARRLEDHVRHPLADLGRGAVHFGASPVGDRAARARRSSRRSPPSSRCS